MPFHVYILYSKKRDLFYVGHTNSLVRRMAEHNNCCSTFTSKGTPWILIWTTSKKHRRSAKILEKKLKNLTRKRKIKFMKKYFDELVEPDLVNSIDNLD